MRGPRPPAGVCARSAWLPLCAACVLSAAAGCGTTISRDATKQMLTADAVDRSVAGVDMRYFSGKTVYLDTEYLEHKNLDKLHLAGSNYLVSSLRQQLMAAGGLLQEKKEDADYVVEPRVGALGADQHEVIYGFPANNLLAAAGQILPNNPTPPAVPEIAIAKRNQESAASSLRLFAYHRDSRRIVWQSGSSAATSEARNLWVLGAGPFQRGDIYGEQTQFAGDSIALFGDEEQAPAGPMVAYDREHYFGDPERADGEVPAEIPGLAEEQRKFLAKRPGDDADAVTTAGGTVAGDEPDAGVVPAGGTDAKPDGPAS